TATGIVGVALGFGSQTLVRDLIGGFFLILENQIRVGDVAAINGVGGLVEAINLRTTVLRDEEGTVHATALMKEIADGMRREDAYQPFMLEPLEVIGVDAFDETAVRLKVRL